MQPEVVDEHHNVGGDSLTTTGGTYYEVRYTCPRNPAHESFTRIV